jgi:hypothetical protein
MKRGGINAEKVVFSDLKEVQDVKLLKQREAIQVWCARHVELEMGMIE